MFKLFIFTSIVLTLRIIAEDAKLLYRRKRVLHGNEVWDRNSGYAVSRYSIWMSHTQICSSFFNTWDTDHLTVACDVDHKKLRCGGALLTPTIVQSACHCLADTTPYANGRPSRYMHIDPNERRFYIFAGWNKVNEMKIGYGATQYIVHEKCANSNLKNSSTKTPYPLMYDYGLLILKTAVAPYAGFSNNKNNYAPLYKIRDLEYMWRRMTSQELVCLFAGYGNLPTGSIDLRHGWGTVKNYLKCKQMVDVPSKNDYFNYVDDATWACFLGLPKHSDLVINGDSGSPVTCDNEYIGVTSMAVSMTDEDTGDYRMNLASPLVFTQFENSEEHRTSLNRLDTNIKSIQSLPRPTVTPQSIIDDFALRYQFTSHSSHIRSVDLCAVAIALHFINKISK